MNKNKIDIWEEYENEDMYYKELGPVDFIDIHRKHIKFNITRRRDI